jgi:hypothetical protein
VQDYLCKLSETFFFFFFLIQNFFKNLAIKIWVEYIQFTIGALNEPNGMEKIRSVCERAVSIGGYHVKNGFTLWEAYRELENAILAGLQVIKV